MITCPNCGDASDVIDSQPSGNTKRRRRQCRGCGEKWTTYEMTKDQVRLLHEQVKWAQAIQNREIEKCLPSP